MTNSEHNHPYHKTKNILSTFEIELRDKLHQRECYKILLYTPALVIIVPLLIMSTADETLDAIGNLAQTGYNKIDSFFQKYRTRS